MDPGGRMHLLYCPICFNEKDARKPRTLPCQHSFCTECLIRWHSTRVQANLDRKHELKCPVCHGCTQLPKGGIDHLPINSNVIGASGIIDATKSVSLCQKCSNKGVSTPVAAFCTDCQLRFCKDCTTEHLKVAVFQAHKLVETMCGSHCAEIKYVCDTCVEGLCTKCVVFGSHKDHGLRVKETGLETIKSTMKDIAKELEKEMVNFKRTLALGEQACAHHLDLADHYINQTCEAVKADIDKIFNDIKIKHREEHTRTIKNIYDERKTILTKGDAIMGNVHDLLKQDDSHFLGGMWSVMDDLKDTLNIIEKTKLSLPDASHMAPSVCNIRGTEDIAAAAQKCDVSCNAVNILSPPEFYECPKQIMSIKCGDGCEIVKPWHISVMPDGSAVVCEHDYRQVSRIFIDGRIKRLECNEK